MFHAISTRLSLIGRRLRLARSIAIGSLACLVTLSLSAALSAAPDDENSGSAGRLSLDTGESTEARVLAPQESPAAVPATPAAETPAPPVAAKAPIDSRAKKTADIGEPEVHIHLDPASFNGITPGRSRRGELLQHWGDPLEMNKVSGRQRLTYRVESFPKVIVTLDAGDVVQSVMIFLERPIGPDVLSKQLKLTGTTSAVVPDERGQPLGEVFPERGVLFAYAPKLATPHVQQVVLEEVEPQPFLLRAETRWRDLPAHSLADAEFALSLDPDSAHGHWMRAQCLSALGKPIEALQAVQRACNLEPEKPGYQLTLAALMVELGDYPRAIKQLEDVIGAKKAPPILEARACLLTGICLTNAGEHDYALAMKFHQKAIQQAEALAADRNPSVRRAAKEILVDAHLGVARDIALGRWQQKDKSVPRWLARAKAFADDLIAHEQAGEGVLQRVHENAMTTLSAVSREVDCEQWIDATQRYGRKLISTAEPQARPILEWRLALALSDCVAIEQAQGRPNEAMKLGELADKLLRNCGTAGDQYPSHDFLAGRLYYRLGAIAAIELADHKLAVSWYDKGVPLLESPVPNSDFTDEARHGDMFVSIAVSYWELGRRQQALRFTKEGAKLIERAVEEGVVQRKVLAVPYGNLATMLTDMGEAAQARRYAELASRSEHAVK